MQPFELNTHSFIVKIWLEEANSEAETGRAVWRGHITHVPGGERRYVADLADIPEFMVPYLTGMGVSFNLWQRIRRWVCNLQTRRHRA